MSSTLFTYRTLPLELRATQRWRDIDVSQMSSEEQERYRHLRNGIELYISTGRLEASAKEARVSTSVLLKQLNRCVAIAADGRIFGWAGLIRYKRIKEYKRRTQLDQSGNSNAMAGVFGDLLKRMPAIKEKLDSSILKRKSTSHIHEARISFKNLTRQFLRFCAESGVREDEYPFNTKYKGYRSVVRYANDLIKENPGRGTLVRHGEKSWQHLQVGGGSKLSTRPSPMQEWALDAHRCDAIGVVRMGGPAGPQNIPIERIWFLPIVDLGTSAIMGYSVSLSREVSAEDVEMALLSAISEWNPKKDLSAGLSYGPRDGLPSYAFPELVGCVPAMLRMDNALQHYANQICDIARRRLGCCLLWNGIGRWEQNAVVERLFKSLEVCGFHRLPSTTGSYPTDPIKNDPEGKAIKHGIDYKVLLDLLDLLVAQYNATPNRGLGGQTPLQVFQNYLDSTEPRVLLRKLPQPGFDFPELGTLVVRRTVRGSQQKGVRPYIQYLHIRYRSDFLDHAFHMVGETLVLHMRCSDISHGLAYQENGEFFDQLVAAGAWGQSPHSHAVGKEIAKQITAGSIHLSLDEDPVEQTLKVLGTKALESANRRPKRISQAATKLAKISNDTGKEVPDLQSELTISDPQPSSPKTTTRSIHHPEWKTLG